MSLKYEPALQILDEMVARGLRPDLLSYTSALRAVSKVFLKHFSI